MSLKSFDLRLPKKVTNPVVFSSPHSGSDYPQDFVASSNLAPNHLRSSEDAFVDDLFGRVVTFGSPLLSATAPRAYVDLNRGPDEFDPRIVKGAKDPFNNPRIASGLGVIPRVVSHGRQIQSGKISMDDATDRVKQFYRPYHSMLVELLAQAKLKFGIALLIDCHSMPSNALQNAMAPGGGRPDIILGNRYGASASAGVFDMVETAFKAQGFVVGRNTPFAGGYITQKHGTPSRNQHVIQVEIDRGLYMNEAEVLKSIHFKDIQTRLSNTCQEICQNIIPMMRLVAE
jgi:N-formylglutamate amidohydrolase